MNKAIAKIQGSEKQPLIKGVVTFCQLKNGVEVTARIFNLPCNNKVFGFHIHEGSMCNGSGESPFSDAKGHYNPDNVPHPYHRGDLPPLFSNDGCAAMSFVTDRFKLCEVIGRTVIIHAMPDDFKTQPAGDAGERIACGVINCL